MSIQLRILFTVLFFILIHAATAQTSSNARFGKKEQALALLKETQLTKSNYWPNVNPELFTQNLLRNIEQPIFFYAGRNTNFCGYAAVGYALIQQDPLGYAEFMINLFKNGKAVYAKVNYRPTEEVRTATGQVLYEGELDRNDADQMLFFTLADHFKGYINIFHRYYTPGAELGLWAATNLSKFNRMLRATMQTEIRCIGYDLFRVKIKRLTPFLQEKLQKGDVFLYINNSVLKRKNHSKIKKHYPTHYILLKSITEENGLVTMTYWDAGFKTQRQIDISTLKKILYGISWSVRTN